MRSEVEEEKGGRRDKRTWTQVLTCLVKQVTGDRMGVGVGGGVGGWGSAGNQVLVHWDHAGEGLHHILAPHRWGR